MPASSFLRAVQGPSDTESLFNALFNRKAYYVSSARTALNLALKRLDTSRAADEILVPPYMSRCLINALNRHAFVAQSPSKQTKAILVYHQYGYRQNMEAITRFADKHGLAILEDSANGWDCAVPLAPGRLCNVVCFSKIFPCLTGAALLTEDPELTDLAASASRQGSMASWLAIPVLLSFRSARRRLLPLLDPLYESYFRFPGGNFLLRRQLVSSLVGWEAALERRWARYRRLQAIVGEGLPAESSLMMPYIFPLLTANIPPARGSELASTLKSLGLGSGMYHIDIHANMLDPDYRPFIPIPLHDGLSDTVLEILVDHLSRLA